MGASLGEVANKFGKHKNQKHEDDCTQCVDCRGECEGEVAGGARRSNIDEVSGGVKGLTQNLGGIESSNGRCPYIAMK